MVTKPEFMKALAELPAEATVQDAIDRLYVLYKIERGTDDLEAGRVLSESELTERVKQWRK
jgi:predicted transcriptional regulator